MVRVAQTLTFVFMACATMLIAFAQDNARPEANRRGAAPVVSQATLAPWATAAPTVVPTTAPLSTSTPRPSPTLLPTLIPTATPVPVWADPASFGEPWSTTVPGVLTFRGSPSRSFSGAGPVPGNPVVQWSYPERAMCSPTTVGDETSVWCGLGWTGQPAVWERDGELWVAFGAFDRAVHFLDGVTGERRLPPFPTGDIIKGSVTVDPDGYPLLYTGSRDGFLRVISFDGDEAVELWSLHADTISPRKWNDDWDSSPLVIDDYLFEGGENSNLHIVRLHRGYDDNGRVTVDPELVVAVPGWDNELIATVGNNVSIENSVAISGNTIWFANSGGLIQGWDLGRLLDEGTIERTFRYWAGDDIDATLVVDEAGFLYAGIEYERGTERSRGIGQLIKLDPSNEAEPLVWSVFDKGRSIAGVWATPAVYRDVVFASTHTGRLLGVDRETGVIRWERQFPEPLWSSQVVVDDVLVQGDCSGNLHAYDITDTEILPPEIWSVQIGGCIESTPVLWDGRIFVGTRAGYFHMLSDGSASDVDAQLQPGG